MLVSGVQRDNHDGAIGLIWRVSVQLYIPDFAAERSSLHKLVFRWELGFCELSPSTVFGPFFLGHGIVIASKRCRNPFHFLCLLLLANNVFHYGRHGFSLRLLAHGFKVVDYLWGKRKRLAR